MHGTRESLEKAVEEARGCDQGDLYREGDRYFFLIGGGTNSPKVRSDFWYTVQWMDAEWHNWDEEEALDWLEEELTEKDF